MNNKLVTYSFIFISMLFWGMSFIWTNSLLNSGYPPISIVFVRLVIVSILLLGVSKLVKQFQKIQQGDGKWFLLMASLEPFLYFIGETYGIQITQSPTLASVIVSTIPIFSVISGYYFYKERVSLHNLVGIVLSIIGVCCVIFHNGISEVNAQLTGILLLFLAVISAVFYATVIKRLSEKYNPMTIVTYQNIIGIVYFLPLFLLVDFDGFISVPFSLHATYPFIMLSVFASGLAFILFVYAIKALGITRANTFTTLIPVLTAVFCFILGTESINWIRIMGICIVVAGLILSQIKPSTQFSKNN